MNINTLEKAVREARNGEDIAQKSAVMRESGSITGAEYRSLKAFDPRVIETGNSGAGSEVAPVAGDGPQITWL